MAENWATREVRATLRKAAREVEDAANAYREGDLDLCRLRLASARLAITNGRAALTFVQGGAR